MAENQSVHNCRDQPEERFPHGRPTTALEHFVTRLCESTSAYSNLGMVDDLLVWLRHRTTRDTTRPWALLPASFSRALELNSGASGRLTKSHIQLCATLDVNNTATCKEALEEFVKDSFSELPERLGLGDRGLLET